LVKFWGKKSQKFHLGLDLANFFLFFSSKIGQENLLNHSFMLCFLVLGKNVAKIRNFATIIVFFFFKLEFAHFLSGERMKKNLNLIVRRMLFPNFQNSFVLKS
jgi:hypothetical protein